MKLLLLDNYDSFTYNLVHYVEAILRQKIDVFYNDAISVEEVAKYDAIILSPGPGIPSEAGVMPELLKTYHHKKAILGVCLGHQAIAESFAGRIFNLSEVFHGVQTTINRVAADDFLFKNIPDSFDVGRYHSWSVVPEDLPAELEVTATADDGAIMAMKHRIYNVRGVQFHPESIMTKHGKTMLKNWLTAQQKIIRTRSSIEGAIS